MNIGDRRRYEFERERELMFHNQHRIVCSEHTNNPVSANGRGCQDCAKAKNTAKARRVERRAAARKNKELIK